MDDYVSLEIENGFDPGFTLAEILKMKNLYKGMGERSLNQQFCEELATKFSNSIHRFGKSSINWEQVRSWFQDLHKALETKVSSSNRKVKKSVSFKTAVQSSSVVEGEEVDFPLHANISKHAVENSQKPKAVSVSELSELVFEAKSSKDLAWYDVASFLNYRVMNSGELEVRVRFAGYDKDQDEWVNVKWGVRERSIPLEHSECERVKVGDMVLCFREDEDLAVYCDARVMDIQRTSHDSEGCCSCIFVVRYDLDFVEDQVQIDRLCCRPAS